MNNKRERKDDKIIRHTALLRASGFDLHYFTKSHVRINNRVDFYLSTGTWHAAGTRSTSKSYLEMVSYLNEFQEEEESLEDKYLSAMIEIIGLKELVEYLKTTND